MPGSQPPSFEDWVRFCFNPSRGDWSERKIGYWEPDPNLLAGWLIRLFNNAPNLLGKLPSINLEKGIWFVFGTGSEYLFRIRDPAVSQEDQVAVVRSMATIYREFFDRIGDSYGTRIPDSTNSFSRVDGAIYMIWDMDCIESAAMFDRAPHLVGPIFEVLSTAIRCKTVTCQVSGLHGLGHLASHHPDRVRRAITELGTSNAAPWVASYATRAKTGRIL